jgi:hypothetical protein
LTVRLAVPRSFLKIVFVSVLATSVSQAQTPAPAKIIGDVVPAAEWQQVAPESVGYSCAKLEALLAWVKTNTGSMMVVVQGGVIFSYSDVTHTCNIRSARKGVLDMLHGAAMSTKTTRRPFRRRARWRCCR